MDSAKSHEAHQPRQSRHVVPQLADAVVRGCRKLFLGRARVYHSGLRLGRGDHLESHRPLGLRLVCSDHHPRGQYSTAPDKSPCGRLTSLKEVQGSHRGSFSSTEASFQNAFELLSYVSTIIWARPDQFRYPVLLSAVAVYTSAFLFGKFLRRRRGHLVHMPLCIKRKESDGVHENF